jgi:tetratricopeptide (TPR) repeat protein
MSENLLMKGFRSIVASPLSEFWQRTWQVIAQADKRAASPGNLLKDDRLQIQETQDFRSCESLLLQGDSMNLDTINELERFWQIQEQALGPFSPDLAITLSKLAHLYRANRDFGRAEALYKRALEIRLKLDNPDLAEVKDTRRCLNQVRQAKRATEQNSIGQGRVLQVDSTAGATTATAAAKSAMGSSGASSNYRSEEEQVAQLKEMELEVNLLKQMAGSAHPAVADRLTKLAELYCRLRMYEKMEPVLIESLKIRELNCGADHASVATESKNLAQVYIVQKRFDKAEKLLRRALLIRTKHMGAAHNKVKDLQDLLAQVLVETDRADEVADLGIVYTDAANSANSASLNLDDTLSRALHFNQ